MIDVVKASSVKRDGIDAGVERAEHCANSLNIARQPLSASQLCANSEQDRFIAATFRWQDSGSNGAGSSVEGAA